ncbi:MAG: O-antigen ligase family protein [Acidipila sp.]|nr:O-antigen ligase family protein [Acidipila sp.]
MTRTLELALVGMMALAVLAFGGTEPISYASLQVVLFAAAICLITSGPVSLPPESLLFVSVPLGLLGIVLLQFVSLPGAGHVSLSIAPGNTLAHLLVLLTSLAAFLLTLSLGGRPRARQRIAYALLAIGGIEALYGLIQYLTGWQQIFSYVKIYSQNAASGTYINENHFAGLLEMILPFALALSLSQLESLGGPGKTAGLGLRRLLGRAESPRFLFWLAASAILFLALIFSFSRMGILAAICSLLWIFGIAASLRLPRRMSAALALLFGLVGGALVLWVGPGPVIKRFGSLGQEAAMNGESRLAIWRDTTTLIRRHPWLGTGLGTFPIAYTSVQTAFLGKFVNHAHNDYLELASDLGIPAASVLFGAILYVPLRTVRRLHGIQRPFDRAIALGSSGSIVAILLHSLADFNLYIPANSMILCVILALALSVCPAQTAQAGAAQVGAAQ